MITRMFGGLPAGAACCACAMAFSTLAAALNAEAAATVVLASKTLRRLSTLLFSLFFRALMMCSSPRRRSGSRHGLSMCGLAPRAANLRLLLSSRQHSLRIESGRKARAPAPNPRAGIIESPRPHFVIIADRILLGSGTLGENDNVAHPFHPEGRSCESNST